MPKPTRASGPVAKRLRSYWKMEAANVFIVPLAAIYVVIALGGAIAAPLLIALAGNMLLLAVGACYWRILLERLEGNRASFDTWLPRLARLQPVAAALTAIATMLTGTEMVSGDGAWSVARITTLVVTALCVLEYVNYYHIQLQYFDNASDFKALLRTRRLRTAHLARDLAEWRRGRN